MTGLRDTVAALAANHRWPLPADAPPDPRDPRLRDVADFGDNPGGLEMRVYAPEGLAPGAALVVVLHGCTQSAQAYAAGSGWLDLAERYGFVALCPEQTRMNNLNLCFNWFNVEDARRDGGEAASIRAMIQQAMTDYPVAPSRVFVTGLSAGGAMANVMLATYPELFAGGAIVAGVPYGAASNMGEAFGAMHGAQPRSPRARGEAVRMASSHHGPWPRISIWQGDADATVRASVADDLVSQWTDVHGLNPLDFSPLDLNPHSLDPLSLDRGRSPASPVSRTAWRGPGGATAVELNRIAGMGHGAPVACTGPDGCGAVGPFLIEAGVSAALESARDWGLADRGLADRPLSRPGETPTVSARQERHETAQARSPSGPDALASSLERQITSVISDTLRRAGLLK